MATLKINEWLLYDTDKVDDSAKSAAHAKFQEIAFAYAILSEPARRARYDKTGSTSESLGLDDDQFSWSDFFRQQWAEVVTGERLDDFKSKYQNSADEERDVLAAYTASKGKLTRVFDKVMMSDVLTDENRFRSYIDAAISKGEVQPYDDYIHETTRTRERRIRNAQKECKEAEKYRETLLGGKKPDNEDVSSDGALAALIQKRVNDRSSFLDKIAAKYSTTSTGKKRKFAEPSEEDFKKTAERMKATKRQKQTEAQAKHDEEDEDEEDEEEEEDEEDEEDDVVDLENLSGSEEEEPPIHNPNDEDENEEEDITELDDPSGSDEDDQEPAIHIHDREDENEEDDVTDLENPSGSDEDDQEPVVHTQDESDDGDMTAEIEHDSKGKDK